ncbi:hypothetical protein ACJ41O_010899 [Fusarium nematophilum]
MASSQTNEEASASQETFKEQLDQAAQDTRDAETQKPNPIVEKITEYVPAAAKVLPGKQSPDHEEQKPDGPPERPDHDDKIEEFVRDQHRSKGTDGILGPSDE